MKLTSKARAAIPSSKFAGPGRSFPIEDRNHAKAALIDVGRSNISPSAKTKVIARARGMLDRVK